MNSGCCRCGTEKDVMKMPVVDGGAPLTAWRPIEGVEKRIEVLLHKDGCFFLPGEKPMPYHPETKVDSGRSDGRHWYEVDVEEWYYACGECL